MGDNPATIATAENGCGMTPEFLRRRLWRLVGGAKGSPSMGIGACRAHEYHRQFYSPIGVSYRVGDDSRFDMRLPAA
jgi:hypothetical protein